MVEEEKMGLCVITTGPSNDISHVQRTCFALGQQVKKWQLEVMWQFRCCAKVSFMYDRELIKFNNSLNAFIFQNRHARIFHFSTRLLWE